LGFFVATSLAMIFFMNFFGYRSYFKVLVISILFNSFIYLLFVWQLKISLPTGLFV
jgi:hypothetical protein